MSAAPSLTGRDGVGLQEGLQVGLPRRFGDLAQLYYPDHNYDSALRHFREEMHLTRGRWKAMQAEGYKENTKTLTRAQVRTIVKFLGEP